MAISPQSVTFLAVETFCARKKISKVLSPIENHSLNTVQLTEYFGKFMKSWKIGKTHAGNFAHVFVMI